MMLLFAQKIGLQGIQRGYVVMDVGTGTQVNRVQVGGVRGTYGWSAVFPYVLFLYLEGDFDDVSSCDCCNSPSLWGLGHLFAMCHLE